MHYVSSSFRLFGLVGIIYTDCSAPLVLHVRPYLDWPQCASPGVLLALYWLLATETRFYFIDVCMLHCTLILMDNNDIFKLFCGYMYLQVHDILVRAKL